MKTETLLAMNSHIKKDNETGSYYKIDGDKVYQAPQNKDGSLNEEEFQELYRTERREFDNETAQTLKRVFPDSNIHEKFSGPKYSTILIKKPIHTHLLAYPDATGIETDATLSEWENARTENTGEYRILVKYSTKGHAELEEINLRK